MYVCMYVCIFKFYSITLLYFDSTNTKGESSGKHNVIYLVSFFKTDSVGLIKNRFEGRTPINSQLAQSRTGWVIRLG